MQKHLKPYFILFFGFNFAIFSAARSETNCADLDQYSATGTRCITSKGFYFSRVQDGWIDEQSKIIWFDLEKNKITQYRALNFCKNNGLALPSGYDEALNGLFDFPDHDSDFVSAEKHGIREVLKDLSSGWFWSSSTKSEDSFYAFYFRGHYGRVEENIINGRGNRLSVRCIGKH